MYKRVRTLLRVSSRQQLHDDDIPVQRAEAVAYIRTHRDWKFDMEYIEKAVSAYKNSVDKREVLQQILEDARAHRFDVLLTYMSDRIGRQEEYSFYVAALNRLGIEVWTIKDGQLKTQEHVDKLLNYIRFWQNEGESKKTGMRVRDTQKEMVKEGKFVGGKAPFGYHLIPSGMVSNHGRMLKKLEIVPQNAQVVRKIYDLATCAGMGYARIANVLNDEGIPAINTEKWKAGTIASILKNPIYMGHIAYGRRINQCGHARQTRENWILSKEPNPQLMIVSQKQWEQAQEIRERRKQRLQRGKESSAEQYERQMKTPFSTRGRLLLSGLVSCGYCRKKLKNGSYWNHWTLKTTGEMRTSYVGRYMCPNGCSEKSSYSQKHLEDIVLGVVTEYLHQMEELDITESVLEVYRRELNEVKRELRQIEQEKKDNVLDIETLENRIPQAIRGDYYFSAKKLSVLIEEKRKRQNILCERENLLQNRESEIHCKMKGAEHCISYKADGGDIFAKSKPEEKRMILALLLEDVVVRKSEAKIVFRLSQAEFRSLRADIL